MKRSWRFYRLTHTSVGYFVHVGNCLQFWPLNGLWPSAAPEEQTDLSKTAGTGSATYTAFRDAHGLKALPQHTLIPSFTPPLPYLWLILFFFLSQNIFWSRWSKGFHLLLGYVIQGLSPWKQRSTEEQWQVGEPQQYSQRKGAPAPPTPRGHGPGVTPITTSQWDRQYRDSSGDGAEEHPWDCTKRVMGYWEEESQVGKGGGKVGLVWKNIRILG